MRACRHRTSPESRFLLTGCREAPSLISENVLPERRVWLALLSSPPPAATLRAASLTHPSLRSVELRLHFVTKCLSGIVRDAACGASVAQMLSTQLWAVAGDPVLWEAAYSGCGFNIQGGA